MNRIYWKQWEVYYKDTWNNFNHNIFSVKNTTISEIKCTIEIFFQKKKKHSIKENIFFFKTGKIVKVIVFHYNIIWHKKQS